MISYLVYFVIYGIIGWLFDTVCRSLINKRFTERSYFCIPFMPVYGFGGLTVLGLSSVWNHNNILIKFLSYSFLLACLEYMAAIFVEKTKHKRMWDYSKSKFNLQGRTDLFRAVTWGILGLFVEYVLNPFISQNILSFLV